MNNNLRAESTLGVVCECEKRAFPCSLFRVVIFEMNLLLFSSSREKCYLILYNNFYIEVTGGRSCGCQLGIARAK